MSLTDTTEAFKKFGEAMKGLSKAMEGATKAVVETWTPGEPARLSEYYGARVRDTSGELVYGWRGENRSSRMAEYTVTVTNVGNATRPGTPMSASRVEAEYDVVAAWGSIGKTMQRQSKQRTTNKTSAITTAAELVREKQKRDYVRVDEYKVDDDEYPFAEVEAEGFAEDSATPAPDVPEIPLVVQPSDDCACFGSAEEMAQALWVDAQPADVSVAPLLTQAGFGLEVFGSANRPAGNRWVVRVDSTCSGGYAHVRAYPVDPDTKASPRVVEELILASLNSRTGEAFDFAFVVEVDGNDLWLVDVIRLEGNDMVEVGWLKRQQTLSARADWVLDRTKSTKGRAIRSPRIVIAGLREEYLGEGDLKAFELHSLEARLGEPGWSLPRL